MFFSHYSASQVNLLISKNQRGIQIKSTVFLCFATNSEYCIPTDCKWKVLLTDCSTSVSPNTKLSLKREIHFKITLYIMKKVGVKAFLVSYT